MLPHGRPAHPHWKVLFSELSSGKRGSGRPKKRWKDCAKEELKAFGLDLSFWHDLSMDPTPGGFTSMKPDILARAHWPLAVQGVGSVDMHESPLVTRDADRRLDWTDNNVKISC